VSLSLPGAGALCAVPAGTEQWHKQCEHHVTCARDFWPVPCRDLHSVLSFQPCEAASATLLTDWHISPDQHPEPCMLCTHIKLLCKLVEPSMQVVAELQGQGAGHAA
jgi:hypothetical protein